MGLVLLVVLGVVLASVAIASQIGSGLVRSGLVSQSREAREAAEAGVLAAIHELNRFENRRLLVASNTLNSWNTNQTNPCVITQEAATLGLKNARPSVGALALRNGAEIQLPGDSNRRFRVLRVQVLNPDRTNASWSASDITTGTGTTGTTGTYAENNVNLAGPDQTTIENGRVGYIRVTVQGRYYRDGAGVPDSTATVTREFQVVAKCCFRSFGPVYTNAGRVNNVFGPDQRSCDAGQNALGLVTFGGGVTKSSGTAMNIKTDTSSPPDNTGDVNIAGVVCISPAACPGVGSLDGGAIPVVESQIKLREVPLTPATTPAVPAAADLNTKVYSNLPNTTYCTATPATNNRYDDNPGATPVPATETAWLCRVNNLVFKNNDLAVYTNAATANATGPTSISAATVPVRLWVEGDISINGNLNLRHVQAIGIAGAPIVPGTTPISDVLAFGAASPNFNDFHLYGRRSGGQQSWELKGNTAGTALFIYAPLANLALGGGGGADNNILGRVWTRSIDVNGSVNITTPPSGGGGSNDIPGVYDYVGRSTWGARLYGQTN